MVVSEQFLLPTRKNNAVFSFVFTPKTPCRSLCKVGQLFYQSRDAKKGSRQFAAINSDQYSLHLSNVRRTAFSFVGSQNIRRARLEKLLLLRDKFFRLNGRYLSQAFSLMKPYLTEWQVLKLVANALTNPLAQTGCLSFLVALIKGDVFRIEHFAILTAHGNQRMTAIAKTQDVTSVAVSRYIRKSLK